MPKKKAQKDFSVFLIIHKFGQGILKFFEMLFDFILALVKILPAFLKTVIWLILVSLLALFVGGILVCMLFFAIGVKDSPNFQAYRDSFVDKFLDEHSLVERVEEVVSEIPVVE